MYVNLRLTRAARPPETHAFDLPLPKPGSPLRSEAARITEDLWNQLAERSITLAPTTRGVLESSLYEWLLVTPPEARRGSAGALLEVAEVAAVPTTPRQPVPVAEPSPTPAPPPSEPAPAPGLRRRGAATPAPPPPDADASAPRRRTVKDEY